MSKLREPSRKRVDLFLPALALLLCLFKYRLAVSLPVEARGYVTDDLLMVGMAENLLLGNWLGSYGAVNLMKGAFFPMFLAGSRVLGSSYLSTLSLLHMVACAFFVGQMRYLICDRRLRFLLFIVLLFDPCSCSHLAFQRVYRSSVTETLVLFLFGSYFGLYLRARLHRSSGDWSGLWCEGLLSLIGGFTLWALWNAREESMWIVPFVAVATILIVLELFGAIREEQRLHSQIGARFLCCLIPLALLAGGNRWIRWENEKHYGAAIRLEEVDGEFADALKTIYSIKNEKESPYTTVSREKLERLYAASESLQMIRSELEEQLARYDRNDRNREDGQVEDGWFFWALKYAAYTNGAADSLPKSQAYWKQVRLELEAALDSPDSDLERQSVMPSALMSPWRPEYLTQLPQTFRKAVDFTISYREVAPLTEASRKSSEAVNRRFEVITNNLVVYENQNTEFQQRLLTPVAAALNGIAAVYRAINPIASVLSAVIYGVFLIFCIRKRATEHVPAFLIVLGMFLSSIVIFCGTAYTEISSFPAIRYDYLAGAYPLMLSGEWLAILYPCGLLLSRRHRDNNQRI